MYFIRIGGGEASNRLQLRGGVYLQEVRSGKADVQKIHYFLALYYLVEKTILNKGSVYLKNINKIFFFFHFK